MKILLATGNPHKAGEIAPLLTGLDIELLTFRDVPGVSPAEEDGKTLEENALKKAALPAQASGLWTMAEDTGLEVEALGGAPGVYSARYAGGGCDFAANIEKLLRELRGLPERKRGAAFRTVVALAAPDGRTRIANGMLGGRITTEPKGSGGFGYDPVFLVPELGKTLAELPPEKKNEISHRGRAVRAMVPHLKRLLGLVLIAAFAVSPAAAVKTDGVRHRTYWEQLMTVQSRTSLNRGAEYMRAARYDDAVKEFARAALANPEDAQTHRMLSVAYYWTGQVDQAEAEVRESIRLEPESAHSHLLLGIIHAWKGRMEASYNSFKRAARYDPDRADIQMNLGSMEETLGMHADALTHFRRAAELDSAHPLYHFQLGMLYRRLGRDEEAIESLQKAIRLYPGYEDAILELGAIHERNGDRKQALKMFEKSVKIKSRDSVARLRLARLYLQDGKKTDAYDVLRDVFHLTPADELGGLALSLSFGGRGGKPAGAPEEGGDEREPGEGGWAPGAQRAQEKGPLDVLRKNLERIPLNQQAVLEVDIAFLPKSKVVAKENEEGPSSLKSALARAGQAPGTLLGARREFTLTAGAAHERAAQIETALKDLKNVMDGAPPDAETRFGMNLSFSEPAGPSASKDGKKPKVAYQPRDVGNDMGLWVKGTGWMRLVDEVLTSPKSRFPHPENSDWWSVEGIGLAILGHSAAAGKAFARALELDEDNELAHLGVGVSRVIVGDEEGAVRSYRKALEINPKNRAAAMGLKWLLSGPASQAPEAAAP